MRMLRMHQRTVTPSAQLIRRAVRCMSGSSHAAARWGGLVGFGFGFGPCTEDRTVLTALETGDCRPKEVALLTPLLTREVERRAESV